MKNARKNKIENAEKEEKRPVELFSEKVIPEKTMAEILKESGMDEWQKEQYKEMQEEKRHREKMKQDRISASRVDKYTHALDLIIERAKSAGNSRNMSIEYYDFNFPDRMDDLKVLEHFLKELKKEKCFEEFERRQYSGGVRFSFIKVNVKNLKKFKEEKYKRGDELFKLKPEMYGIGINLKVLLRRCKMFWNKLTKRLTKK